MNSFVIALAVTFAGGLGAVLRFYVAQWNGKLPWGILAANTLASFILGIYLVNDNPQLWIVVSAFAGGLSTFSSFAAQTTHLVVAKQRVLWVANSALTLVLPLFAVWLGAALDALVK